MKRPNLIYVFADQLRAQSVGYLGDAKAHTPNIDKLAAESASFVNAVSVAAVCAPYRNSLFTGKYVSSTGMVINEIRAMPDPDAIGHVLTEHGYNTGYIGKWHLYGTDHTPPQQFTPKGEYRMGWDGYWAANNFNHEYFEGFYYGDTPERIKIDGYEPDAQTQMAIDFMREAKDQDAPFALALSYGTPHDPWERSNCPEEWNALFCDVDFPDPPNYADGSAEFWAEHMDREWWLRECKPFRFQYRQVYYAMTANLDWNLGRLLREVEELGLAEDTVLIFTSDHGEMFGSHGRIAKSIFYEEAVRVPFLIRQPGRIAPRESDVCLNTPDIAPTLCGLLRLPVPSSYEGMDLSTHALTGEGQEPDAALLQGMGAVYQWRDGYEWRAVRDKRRTFAIEREGRVEHLYDNVADPYQLRNIEDPALRSHYRRLLKEKMALFDDTFEACTWYGEHWVKDKVILRSTTRSL